MQSLWTRLVPSIKQPTRVCTTLRLFSYTPTRKNDEATPPNRPQRAKRPPSVGPTYYQLQLKRMQEDPEYRQTVLEARHQAYEVRKKRFQEDAEYRQTVLEARHQAYEVRKKRFQEDAEYRQTVLEARHQAYEVHKKRMQEDAEYRARNLVISRAKSLKKYHEDHDFADRVRTRVTRRRTDPEKASQIREKIRICMAQKLKDDDDYYQRERFRLFVFQTAIIRGLEWVTHQPIVFDEKIRKHCASCRRLRPLKMWWKRKTAASAERSADAEQFDCMLCFYNQAGDHLMPIGYENMTFDRPNPKT